MFSKMSEHQVEEEEVRERFSVNTLNKSDVYKQAKKPRGFLGTLGLSFNSRSDNTDIFTSVPKLIRRRQWKKLGKTLQLIEKRAGGHKYSVSLPQDLLCISGGRIGEEEENCLHLACRYSAPLLTIQRICAISPDILFETTTVDKRTPLHVAVSVNAVSIEVVDFLISLDVGAPCSKDIDGCTPLHLICRYSDFGRCIDPFEDPFVTYPVLAIREEVGLIVRTLCDVHPWCINDEDKSGRTPIEYAIDSKLEYTLIKYMWAISSSQWRKQRECEEKLRRSSYDQNSIRREQILREKVLPAWEVSTDDMSDDSSNSLAGLMVDPNRETDSDQIIQLI